MPLICNEDALVSVSAPEGPDQFTTKPDMYQCSHATGGPLGGRQGAGGRVTGDRKPPILNAASDPIEKAVKRSLYEIFTPISPINTTTRLEKLHFT